MVLVVLVEEAVERAKNTHVATTSLFVSSGRRCSLNGVSHFGFEQSLASHICKVKNHASCERRTACGSLGPLSRTGCGCWCAASVSTCRTLPSKMGRKSMKRSEAMEGGKKGREEEGWARGCDCRQNLCVVTCSSVPMRLGKSLLQRSAIRTPTSNPAKSASDNEGNHWLPQSPPIFSRTRSFAQDSAAAAVLAVGLHSS